jgi:hypothetical protein
MGEQDQTPDAPNRALPRGRPEDAPRCPDCRYLLYGIELKRCPECGLELTADVLSAARQYAESSSDSRAVMRRQTLIHRLGYWTAVGSAGVLGLFALLHPRGTVVACLIILGAPLTLLILLLRAAYDWPPHWAMLLIGIGWALAAGMLLLV